MSDAKDELAQITEAIQNVQNLHGVISAEQVAVMLAPLQQKLVELEARLAVASYTADVSGSGASAQGAGATAVGQQGANISGSTVTAPVITGKQTIIYAEQGAKVVIGEDAPEEMSAVARESALGRYLAHIIARNRLLQLQGIRSGGRLVHIELEHIYIMLRATQQRTIQAEEAWLLRESALAPGERRRMSSPAAFVASAAIAAQYRADFPDMMRPEQEKATETVTVSVNEALRSHRRLVVLGDPGSGKTTLLRYLALVYARDKAQESGLVAEKLNLTESGLLPILLPLRQIGAFLESKGEASTEGHSLLLRFLHQSLQNERIDVPLDFFDAYLQNGQAVILLDGMDEVAGSDLRRRVAEVVDSFTRAYAGCRFVVTSRIVGYKGAARLGEGYVTTTVRDFSLEDVAQFLGYWHKLVAVGQMGPGENADFYAQQQTMQLMEAVQNNERIRELAINPLMLTVIALVHRDRVRLPDRRAELYAEAVDVLLGKWDEARGVIEQPILDDKPFDTGDKRLMLQTIALHMHEQQQKEIEIDALRRLLFGLFREMADSNRGAERALTRFLAVIEERTGLLAARGDGVYAFSHLTFQEYLAALAAAARPDALTYTLDRSGDSWWREVILLQAGYLSTQSKERTTLLIQAVADRKEEPEPYHNLVLAADCLRDVGGNRVQGNLQGVIRERLWQEMKQPLRKGVMGSLQTWVTRGMSATAVAERRIAAVTALSHIDQQRFWTQPYGEPEWVRIPAGEFIMGSEQLTENEQPHRLYLEPFLIARVPITNAQYYLFVQAVEHEPPPHWEDGRPPKNRESHPVTQVTWYDALAYCRWLSQVTGKHIRLPSEAEWEKAARGERDAREYPWGDNFDRLRCNSQELGLETTTPVGIFLDGSSPYGVLDMSGNVWEWTRSLYQEYDLAKWQSENKVVWKSQPYAYPYDAADGREDLSKGDEWTRVLRGGSWYNSPNGLRLAARLGSAPYYWYDIYGFRVAASPSTSDL